MKLYLVLLFLLGLALIVRGGDLFVDSAVWMAEASGIPRFIIGATVVSLATTLPELLVSLLAAVQGRTDMAVGNAVGSVTANTALILGAAMAVRAIPAPRAMLLPKALCLLGALGLLLLGSRGVVLSLPGCLGLFLTALVFFAESLFSARRCRDTAPRSKPLPGQCLCRAAGFLLGGGAIGVGAQLLVQSGSAGAALLGVPEGVVGVTVLAVGTSLPELVTTVTALLRGRSDLSAGNILGANIIDTALVLPLCSLASGQALTISPAARAIDIPVCLLAVGTALLPALFTQRLARWQGFVLLGLYGGWLWGTAAAL